MSKKKIKAEEYNNYGKTIMFDLGESKGKFDKIYMTPLQAFEDLFSGVKFSSKDIDFDTLYAIVETALKQGEMEHTLRNRLENVNYELVRDNQAYKKTLEIIKKKRVDVQLLKDSKNLNDYNWCVHTKDRALTKEEYNLLKEMLK